MDIAKLSGIVDEIEVEGRQPSPSHGHLAKLIAMFIREVMGNIQSTNTTTTTSGSCEAVIKQCDGEEQEIVPKKLKNAKRPSKK